MVRADVFPVFVSADAQHGRTLCVWDELSWGYVAGCSLVRLFFLFPLLPVCVTGWGWLYG